MSSDQFTDINRNKADDDNLFHQISETIPNIISKNIREKQAAQRKERRLQNLEKKIKKHESKQSMVNNTNQCKLSKLERDLNGLKMEVGKTRRIQWFVILLLFIINVILLLLK